MRHIQLPAPQKIKFVPQYTSSEKYRVLWNSHLCPGASSPIRAGFDAGKPVVGEFESHTFPVNLTPFIQAWGHQCACTFWFHSRQSSPFFLFLITLGLEMSDTNVYEPCIRALLGAASHYCEAVVVESRAVPFGTALGCHARRV